MSNYTVKVLLFFGLSWLFTHSLAFAAQPAGETTNFTSCRKGLASPERIKLASVKEHEKNREVPLLLHIEDTKTGKTSDFPLLDQDGNTCASVLSMVWLDEDTLGLECHINPSLSNYLLVDATSGKCRKNFYGYNFCWSPDGKVLAHVGAIPHFAPPECKSEYLQFNDRTVYPQPAKAAATGKVIHSFKGPFCWSRNSRWVAFLDSVVNDEDVAKSLSLVVVSREGRVSVKPLPLMSDAQIQWASDSRSVCVSAEKSKRQLKFKLPF